MGDGKKWGDGTQDEKKWEMRLETNKLVRAKIRPK